MKDSKIEWTDHTFNPWEGCTKVSPGCAHCYAETRNARFSGGKALLWGKGAPRRRTSAENWKQPLNWDRATCIEREATQAAGLTGTAYTRPRVFCASLADVFDEEVPDAWRDDLFELVAKCRNLDWLILTKRPEKMRDYLLGTSGAGADNLEEGGCLDHLWLGTTVEDQQRADERIPVLCSIPARVRFLSCEPLLEGVNLRGWLGSTQYGNPIRWVICGGESGPGARPMHPGWARSLRDQCKAAGVPFLFKQWGNWLPSKMSPDAGARFLGDQHEFKDVGGMVRNPDKSVRLLDGVEHNGFPSTP